MGRRKEEKMTDKMRRMLIVDDQAEMLSELEEIFSSRFRVFKALDGKRALDMVQNLMPEIVVMDIAMPIMDGMEACRCIKNDPATSHIPVIILTGKGGILDIEKGFQAGADSFLAKPIMPSRLIVKVNEMLERSELKRERRNGTSGPEQRD
jgi:CheY-like chemotaxis protein